MSVLDELRALESVATAAPWHVEGNSVCSDNPDEHYVVEEVAEIASDARLPTDADALLIAAARNVLPTLLDMADAALHATPFLDPLNDDAWSVRNRIIAAFARLEERA